MWDRLRQQSQVDDGARMGLGDGSRSAVRGYSSYNKGGPAPPRPPLEFPECH